MSRRPLLPIVLGTGAALLLFGATLVAGTLLGWWRRPWAPPGDPGAFAVAAVREIEAARPGNVAFVLLEQGTVFHEHFASLGDPVDRDTRFQVASLSKWITAWGVMALVEQGLLSLDDPVGSWTTRWRLPDGPYDEDAVTVRRLLSHTAGLTDGLGYAGFPPGTAPQTLEESLTRAADASPHAEGSVRVGHPPGSRWQYSGGGYTLLQLLIEEVTGGPFESAMQRLVLRPLRMARSTFDADLARPGLAAFYDVGGGPAPHYRFTALAAASLYTSAADLTRFLQAHLPGPQGEAPGRGVLSPEALVLMRTPHASRLGVDIWGLGTILYAPNGAGDFVIGHDGHNTPAINTSARLDPATGNGVVVLVTGDPELATRVAGEWVFWRTGNVDILSITRETPAMLRRLAAGCAAIVLAGLLLAWRVGRTRERR